MTVYSAHDDPYAFIRSRAAQLFCEGDMDGARTMLRAVDKAQIKLLKKERKAKKHKPFPKSR